MNNWILIKDVHINLNNIVAFSWRKGKLFIDDVSGSTSNFQDPDKHWYREMYDFIGMNMSVQVED